MRCLSLLVVIVVFGLAACQPEPPPRPQGVEVVTPHPTLDIDNPAQLCAAVDAAWGRDWSSVIRALEALWQLDASCEQGLPVGNLLYSAYIGYGTLLEQRGRRSEAIDAYQTSLSYNFTGREAIQRLRFLEVIVPEQPPRCADEVIQDVATLIQPYEPTSGEFVRIQNGSFFVGQEPYYVYGVNYYPRDYPGERFFTQMNVESIGFELDLMRASGLNTLRVHLRHQDLFICPGNGAVPIPANIARLDGLIQEAFARGFRLILVMNHDADLLRYPLYARPEHTVQQMLYLANRYRDEPAVMAYDLRESGDADYAANTQLSVVITREEVLNWLADMAVTVKQAAPRQLITAGWQDDSAATIPLVDFVSFKNFGDVGSLRQEIANLRAETSRPLLLAAVGYNTYDVDELGQRLALQRAFEAVQQNGLTGWIVTTAFDYPLSVLCSEPDCLAEDGPENRFGLWNTSYFPKRSVDAVEQITGIAEQNEP